MCSTPGATSGSLYTVSEHVAPPFGYRKVRRNLDRILRNLVARAPDQP